MPHRLTTLLDGPAPWIVGVLNVTPDSFTDGGLFLSPDAALAQGRKLLADGAHLVEVGGESTAPGRRPIPIEEELRRALPVVQALAEEGIVAVDTYRAETAARCLEAGARVINDVSALRADPELAGVVAANDAVLVMMYAKDAPLPHVTDAPVRYRDIVVEIGDFLAERVDAAARSGIPLERVAVDPGMGRFISLDPADSWRLLEGFARLVERLAPVPVMIASSRKGFFGVPMPERDPVSQLTAFVAAERGAALIRTHDARMARQFVDAGRKMGVRFPAEAAFGSDQEPRP